MVNDATVTTSDVIASNGIVHIIDKVLMPPADETPTTAASSGSKSSKPFSKSAKSKATKLSKVSKASKKFRGSKSK